MIALGLLVGVVASARARASNHCVIVTDINNTKNDFAFLDFTSDPPNSVTALAYLPAGPAAQTLTMNSSVFATTSNLFDVTGGGSTLVCAGTADPTVTSNAALRQQKLVMTIPAMSKTSGVSFGFPLNDAGTGAFILIGNPGLAQATGGLSYGPPNSTAATLLAVPSFGVQIVPIPAGTAATRVNVNIGNNLPVIVQVLINGKGQEFTMTFAEPTH
jgi:hypothetical protein